MEKITFKGLDYYPVVSETGRVWLDRNLGATRVAQSPDDQDAYGDYFTFDKVECPEGWRLPTKDEWKAEIKTWVSRNIVGAYESVLRLPAAGYRDNTDGALFYRGYLGYYWNSSESGTILAWHPYFSSGYAYAGSYGFSVRLIKNI